MFFVLESAPSKMKLINYFFESAFILNDDTAQLCLQLIALSFDETVVLSFRPGMFEAIQISLFTIFSRSIKKLAENKDKQGATVSSRDLSIDFSKLVDVMLLGRNQKSLRIVSAHILKGIYDTIPLMQGVIKECLVSKIP